MGAADQIAGQAVGILRGGKAAVPDQRPGAASPTKARRRWSLVTRALMVLCGLAAALGVFASAARADVNTTSNGYGVATMSNCTIYVGDQASPYRYAVGDTTIRCGSHHNIWVYTELYRNGVLVEHSKAPYLYYANATYVHDAPTAAYGCGATAQWYTVSWVIVDSGAWQGWTGPTEKWAPC